MSRNISEEIEQLCAKRRELWASGENGEEAKRLGERIDALYADKRAGLADHGTDAARAKAVKRALAERELDRLMTA